MAVEEEQEHAQNPPEEDSQGRQKVVERTYTILDQNKGQDAVQGLEVQLCYDHVGDVGGAEHEGQQQQAEHVGALTVDLLVRFADEQDKRKNELDEEDGERAQEEREQESHD